MIKPICVLPGDRYGVGPELVAKLLARPEALPVPIAVLGDPAVLEAGARSAKVSLDIPRRRTFADWGRTDRALVERPFDIPVMPLGQVAKEAGLEVLDHLSIACAATERGEISGICYAPFNKQALRLAGHEAGDELDFLLHRMAPEGMTGEINILGDIWTSRVTSHVPLRDAAGHITRERVVQGVALLAESLIASGKARPRLLVAALNPHAGEGGAYGTEEIEIIAPAVETARAAGYDVTGPLPGDTVFPTALRDGFDGVVTMFHDQGQIALKLMGLGKGVTYLAGLPVPVATPGHGTAYDIAGEGVARADGMAAALRLVATLAGAQKS